MKPHHPTPEAIELTEGEKDKIMNDFLLPTASLDFSRHTLEELTMFSLALGLAYIKCEDSELTQSVLKKLSDMVNQAKKDLFWEGQQLPWKD